ncbi:MAG TPA: hypothetical protein PKM25_16810 [Candidatus Ozemobacteraceae bacterium]|nr:hypothetical protein [Candidatus Ozemobacteraceae bacterium]
MHLRPHLRRPFISAILALAVLCFLAGPAFAAVSFYYERAITDAWGNEVGYQTVLITSIDQLPAGSPWRTYLTSQISGSTIWDYTRKIGSSLSQPLSMLISDRNSVSSSFRSTNGYNLRLYRHVTQYSSDESKKFVFLHEMGHVAMLNAYPGNYSFTGLDYGSDNTHTLDEILPNTNTAWIEGWANAFAALKNNGKVFSLALNSSEITAFLVDKTFEQMTRNELFIGKNLYDIMTTFPSGQSKVYNLISTTGPHASLRDFCRAYVRLYPADQVALAKLLDKNGYSKASLSEMLDYLNNGSRTVTREFYAYLQQRGSIAGGSTTASNTSTSSTQTTTPKKSFWSRISDFFSGLFGNRASTAVATVPAASVQPSLSVNADVVPYGQVLTSQTSIAPLAPGESVEGSQTTTPKDLASAQEEYFAAFAAYNEALSRRPADPAAVKAALARFQTAKTNLTSLKNAIGN